MKSFRLLFYMTLSFFIFADCDNGNDLIINDTEQPLLKITDGSYELDTVAENSGDFGSGLISFNYEGERNGTFAVSGTLRENQVDNGGAGGILAKTVDDVLGTISEGFSMIGFLPTNNGKADILILGYNLSSFPIEKIKTGTYNIGLGAPFTGIFLKGIDITDFWKGEKDLVEAAEFGIVLMQGSLTVASRDSAQIEGTFSGTSESPFASLSKFSGNVGSNFNNQVK